mmetsp:Transcript_5994/g.9759  ORF Transcript_5994/g.9759 Transcript_5994/m.9759 type:complete len:94 (-) Transcript_5994:62-343(-)
MMQRNNPSATHAKAHLRTAYSAQCAINAVTATGTTALDPQRTCCSSFPFTFCGEVARCRSSSGPKENKPTTPQEYKSIMGKTIPLQVYELPMR